jgi:hypothetical protein
MHPKKALELPSLPWADLEVFLIANLNSYYLSPLALFFLPFTKTPPPYTYHLKTVGSFLLQGTQICCEWLTLTAFCPPSLLCPISFPFHHPWPPLGSFPASQYLSSPCHPALSPKDQI